MRLYWRERRAGQRLVLLDDFGAEIEVGAVRQTKRGFDALAKTNTYDPGRAQKGFASLEEAKEFVEFFHPWDIFGRFGFDRGIRGAAGPYCIKRAGAGCIGRV